jgi:hypothetical protein
MPDYTPFSGRYRPPAVTIELSRVLWTMRSGVGKEITAAIFNVATGRELRIALGEELLESRLSRTNDTALESRADEVRALLTMRGWSG